MTAPLCYCGRDFSAGDIQRIQELIAARPEDNRATLSRAVCTLLDWRRHNSDLKEMSCRVAMLRMQKDGLLQLPPPRNGNANGRAYQRRTDATNPDMRPLPTSVGSLATLRLELVRDRKSSHLWNEYIDRYHYLGYQPLPGAQLRYVARTDDRILALLGFGAAAWKTAPRDLFIGWSTQQRTHHLHRVVNNARFLILPWVRCQNLASRLLALAERQLPVDWHQAYGYRPVMLETFVEIPRFLGTCYKAANWHLVGETTGRGKLDVDHSARLPKKAIWIRPLTVNFRRILCT
jgi:hypothetical protein